MQCHAAPLGMETPAGSNGSRRRHPGRRLGGVSPCCSASEEDAWPSPLWKVSGSGRWRVPPLLAPEAAYRRQIFALIVFSCIIGEGYTNHSSSDKLYCIFNHSEDACRYGIGIGVIAFLACVFFLMVDIYFPQISNATDRKYLVMADLGFSALWAFLWFIGFCVLTNQWSSTAPKDVLIGADSARASIAFSFFSIFSWGLLITFALQRYRMGVQDFDHSYIDPAPGPAAPYSSYPNVGHESYQQPPFTPRTGEDSEGYQPPPVY